MYISPSSLSIALSFSVTSLANPLQRSATLLARDDPKPSDYPYGDAATNEFKWVNRDPKNDQDKKDGQKIHQAFIEWKDLVKQGAVAAADKDGATFKRWFGKQDDPAEIKNVFGNMWDGSNANKIVADMVCDRKDFQSSCKGQVAAYTMPDTGVFHVCQYGLDRPQLSDIKCDSLDESCSSKMRSLSMTLLHEMTHYNSIGAAARGSIGIVDDEAGAYDCFKADDDAKGDNAQNYAWLAGLSVLKPKSRNLPRKSSQLTRIKQEAYYSTFCSKTFKDPKENVVATVKDEDIGVSRSPLPAGASKPFPDPICPGTTAATPAVAFPEADAANAINTFCSHRKYWGQVVVPLVSFGTGLTSDGRHKALGMSDSFPVNGDADKLWLGLSFSEDECMGMFQFDVGKDDNESLAHCVDRFETVLNGCKADATGKRIGGELHDACAVYRITARQADQPDPMMLKSSSDPGTFTCQNFDTSAIGGSSSSLANTCQCYYSNVPGPTDIFKKPQDGNCAKADKTELVTN